MSKDIKRLVIGISGASGMIYPVRLLRALPQNIKVHLVYSEVGKQIMKDEIGWDFAADRLSDFMQRRFGTSVSLPPITVHNEDDSFACIASGSYRVNGMIVCPCSMKTLSGIAHGYANSLIERAADVNLKEKRPLILVIRETPFNRIHLKNMLKANDAGAIILPANPAFYQRPETIDDLADFIAARILNLLNIEQDLFKGWRETD
jgi:flavin prenyltransferase